MKTRFYLDTQNPPELGPISKRWEWCCDNGCGACEATLVEYRNYLHQSDDEIVEQRTEPRLVSSCCGVGMFLWDSQKDEDGPTGYDGGLSTPQPPDHAREKQP